MATRPFVNDIFQLKSPGNQSSGGQGEWINIYTGKENIQDPYEANVVVTYNNPLPVIAVVTDLTAESVLYKMPGITVNDAKEIFVMSKYRSLIDLSQVIEVRGEKYEGYRISGKLQIRQMAGNVLRLYVYRKVV